MNKLPPKRQHIYLEQITIKQTFKKRLKMSSSTGTSPDGFITAVPLRLREKGPGRYFGSGAGAGRVGGSPVETPYLHGRGGRRPPLLSPRYSRLRDQPRVDGAISCV